MMACNLNRLKFAMKSILVMSAVVGCSNAFALDAGKAPGFNFPGLTSIAIICTVTVRVKIRTLVILRQSHLFRKFHAIEVLEKIRRS